MSRQLEIRVYVAYRRRRLDKIHNLSDDDRASIIDGIFRSRTKRYCASARVKSQQSALIAAVKTEGRKKKQRNRFASVLRSADARCLN